MTTNELAPTIARPVPGASAAALDVLLTFDDGPVPESLGTDTRTAGILNYLRSKGARGVFFIQIYSTHDDYPKRFTRANTPEGIALVRRMQAEGHVVGLHSASFKNHANHTERVNNNGVADKQDKLWRDLDDHSESIDPPGRQAIQWMERVTGIRPEFVRPCYGDSNPEVRAVYRVFRLKNILWDIDPEDWKDESVLSNAATEQKIEQQVQTWAAQQRSAVIVILHDTIQRTVVNLAAYVAAVERGAARTGRQARLVTDTERAKEIMRSWAAEHAELQ